MLAVPGSSSNVPEFLKFYFICLYKDIVLYSIPGEMKTFYEGLLPSDPMGTGGLAGVEAWSAIRREASDGVVFLPYFINELFVSRAKVSLDFIEFKIFFFTMGLPA